jgi:hypothetical protein
MMKIAYPIVLLGCLLFVPVAQVRAETDAQLIKAPPETRQVGIAYAAWHDQIPWGKTWDVPQLGQYLSTDPNYISSACVVAFGCKRRFHLY